MHCDAARIFEQLLGAHNVAGKHRPRLLTGAKMRPAVRSQFVTIVDDGSHQPRIALCNPAESEKRRLRLAIGKQLKDAIDIPFDAALAAVPLVPLDMREESLDLEIVLHIDGHGVEIAGALDRNWSTAPAGDRIVISPSNFHGRSPKPAS